MQRFSKAYRHPALDARITLERLVAEARCLLRARRNGVDVPRLYAADTRAFWASISSRLRKEFRLLNEEAGALVRRGDAPASLPAADCISASAVAIPATNAADIGTAAAAGSPAAPSAALPLPSSAGGGPRIIMEWVHGITAKAAIDALGKGSPVAGAGAGFGVSAGSAAGSASSSSADGSAAAAASSSDAIASERAALARDIGAVIARLHNGGIVHGDLTTSNVMVRAPQALPDALAAARTAVASASASSSSAAAHAVAPVNASSIRLPDLPCFAGLSPLDRLLAEHAAVSEALAELAPAPSGGSAAAAATASASASVAAASDAAAAAPPPEQLPMPPQPVDAALHAGLRFPVLLIDFGLASMSSSAEDRAVDLYVLERAVLSAHATAEEEAEADGEGANGDDVADDVDGAGAGGAGGVDADNDSDDDTAFAGAAAGEPAAAAAAAAAADPHTAAGLFAIILAGYLSTATDAVEVGRRYEAVRRRGRKRLAFG